MITKNYRQLVLSASMLAHALSAPLYAFPDCTNSTAQDAITGRQRAGKIRAESEGKKAENKEFLDTFRSLPPEARIDIWKQSNNAKYRQSVAYRAADGIQDLLIIEGTDTVPQLAAIIRDSHEPYFYRFWAAKILADMDRYVPAESIPKGAAVTVTLGAEAVNLRGAVNPFLEITGRRIGDQGREALEWAATKADDKWLQFFVRNDMGLVRQELATLPLAEQVQRWRASVAQGQRTEGRPESFVREILGRLLVERAPESLPALLDLLNHDRDRYVRTAVVGLIREVDVYRFRLRKTELGRSAIEAVRTAVVDVKVKLTCPECSTPAQAWAVLSGQFFNDDLGLNPGSLGAYYAQMLHTLYDENTIRVVQVGTVIKQEWAIPEFTAFIAFLTDKDPFFPSWEYSYSGPSYSEAFHPRFADKMARIEDAWKQYKAGGIDLPPSSAHRII